jgi:hypothetical protein
MGAECNGDNRDWASGGGGGGGGGCDGEKKNQIHIYVT